ncbi:MAG: tannase/feruloyl esterase family alpha/beta hydrolase [Gammaproteobacteria bacterium]
MIRTGLACLLLALGGCAADGPPTPAAGNTGDCAGLADRLVPGGRVSAADLVEADGELPAYCRVRGVIDPRIRYEARLPVADWNGKYYQSGCGGYCGSVLPDKPGFSNTINEALKLGYAAITTDNGHVGGLGDASWAADDPVAVEVYAHRGIVLTYRFGTQLVGAYYGVPPRYEYFGRPVGRAVEQPRERRAHPDPRELCAQAADARQCDTRAVRRTRRGRRRPRVRAQTLPARPDGPAGVRGGRG